MEKNLRDEIKERNEIVVKMSKMVDEKLKSYPNGKLYIKHNKHGVYYYLNKADHSEKEKALGKKEIELINKMIQKAYLEKVKKVSQNELEALKRIQKLYPEIIAEEVYDQLTEERKNIVKPIIPTDEQLKSRWQDQPYPRKPISDEVPFFETMRGERVRSKSEVIIADRLLISGIPYKYECPLKVGKRVIHPDFTILKLSDRRVVYYEHCGKLDDPEYAEDMVNRVNDYNHAGIIQGESLFMTFETSKTPLDVRVLDKMIKENFR